MPATITLREEAGSGRAFAVLYDDPHCEAPARQLCDLLTHDVRRMLMQLAPVTRHNCSEICAELLALVKARELSQISLIGIADAAAVAQKIALERPKLVRSLVLVDAHTRPHPGRAQRLLEALERRLPLGLPLRKLGRGFDGKPFLQRLRCPVLLVTTRRDAYSQSEARVLHERLPVAWRTHCDDSEQLADCLRQFQQIPTKRPQKNNPAAGRRSPSACHAASKSS